MYGVYSVLDVKSGEFRSVFLQRSNESAIRMFSDAIVHGEDSMLRRYPADYQLHRVGEFSELSGVLAGSTDPEYLISAEDILRRVDAPRRDGSAELSGQLALEVVNG